MHIEISTLVVVSEFERTDARLAGMCPSRLGDIPVMQGMFCLKGSGELKLVPNDLLDRPRTSQRQGVSQAVVYQPEFLVLSI